MRTMHIPRGSSPVLTLARSLAFATALAGAYGILVFLAGSLPGCTRMKQKCYDDLDCTPPKICSPSGDCVFPCMSDADCGPGFACVDHVCQLAPQGPITCPPDMVPVADAFCIDRYEASRPDATASDAGVDETRARSVAGVLPWQVVSNAAAEAACEAVGKRLCTPEEWLLACQGPDGTVYSYGDTYEPTTCNGIDAFGPWPEYWLFHLMPTGSFPGCTNEWGVFDINGNVWEHTAGGDNTTVRGGAFNCSDSPSYHRCEYVPGWEPSARGFRCCQSPPPAGGGVSALSVGRSPGGRLLSPAAP